MLSAIEKRAAIFLRHPTPGPWDDALATCLIRMTAAAIDHRLHWCEEWATDEWFEAWMQIDAAWEARDRWALAQACIAFWHRSREIAEKFSPQDS